MNTALRLETSNASGGVKHPPFHFDYVEVDDGTRNAHAFQHDGFSFIVVTQPLVESLWDLSVRLSRSTLVLQLLGLKESAVRIEAVHALLFQLQLTFLVSHEYTHHVHRDCERDATGMPGFWTEFASDGLSGGMDRQALELDADAYALYLVLANFVRGGGRQGALSQIGKQHLSNVDADSLILGFFLVAVIAFFGERWSENIEMESISRLTHPPAPVRIDFTFRFAEMWCNQNRCAWFAPERLQEMFGAVVSTYAANTRQGWDAQIAFLRSEAGTKYSQKLLDLFEMVRKGTDIPVLSA